MELLYPPALSAHTIWADAQATIRDLVRHGVPAAQCTAIPCPPLSRVIFKLPQKEHEPTFLFVSRIVKMKGIEDVIRAFSLICDVLPLARLWVVGTGEEAYLATLKHNLKLRVKRLRVTFYGYVSEKKSFFNEKSACPSACVCKGRLGSGGIGSRKPGYAIGRL